MKRWIILGVLAVSVALLFLTSGGQAFSSFWRRCLVVSVPMEKADALIVLGGEPLARPQEAARLYSHGVAPVIYVTGEGDSARNRQVLMSSGVPSSAILLETKATTTFGNAMLLKPLLEKAHVTSALIVTSPFHSRRALATFRKLIPGVRFGVVDASISWWEKPQGQGDVNRFALVEFLKILEYRLLYGVSPFLKSSI